MPSRLYLQHARQFTRVQVTGRGHPRFGCCGEIVTEPWERRAPARLRWRTGRWDVSVDVLLDGDREVTVIMMSVLSTLADAAPAAPQPADEIEERDPQVYSGGRCLRCDKRKAVVGGLCARCDGAAKRDKERWRAAQSDMIPACERKLLTGLNEALKPAKDWAERAKQAKRIAALAETASIVIQQAVNGGGSWEAAMVAAAEANRGWTEVATKWLECGLHGKCGNPAKGE